MSHEWASGGGWGKGFDRSPGDPVAISVQGYTAEEAAAAGIDMTGDPSWAEWREQERQPRTLREVLLGRPAAE